MVVSFIAYSLLIFHNANNKFSLLINSWFVLTSFIFLSDQKCL